MKQPCIECGNDYADGYCVHQNKGDYVAWLALQSPTGEARTELMRRLRAAWARDAHTRLGQLIANALYDSGLATHPLLRELFFVKDERLIKAIEDFMDNTHE